MVTDVYQLLCSVRMPCASILTTASPDSLPIALERFTRDAMVSQSVAPKSEITTPFSNERPTVVGWLADCSRSSVCDA